MTAAARRTRPVAPRDLYPQLAFPWEVAQTLGWYVYALRDPRPRRYGVFYIGKGTVDRVFSHVQAVLRGALSPDGKDPVEVRRATAERIRGVHEAGRAVEHLILRESLSTSREALVAEQAVIDAYLATGHALTNTARGHQSDEHGLSNVEHLTRRRAASPAPKFPAGTLLFHVRKSYYPGIGARDLYAATRGNWAPSPMTRARSRFAFGIVGDVVVSAYAIKRWRPATTPGETHLWTFIGEPDPALRPFIGTHVRDVVSSSRKEFRVVLL